MEVENARGYIPCDPLLMARAVNERLVPTGILLQAVTPRPTSSQRSGKTLLPQ